ncbi:hypothetical protein PIB30_089945 [Stylosanthes scabra]|uniref:Uncharacterized protein n=1 Tax=Stylosanthes scabra TaxID=79078 RepID=A0ABU6ZT18_9FABA|nr:hypothetical protein [Stylosanthes scabra]
MDEAFFDEDLVTTAGDRTSECTGPLSKLWRVRDKESLSLKGKRAGDYGEYQCQIKNKPFPLVCFSPKSGLTNIPNFVWFVHKGGSMETAVCREETMHKISYRDLYNAMNKHKPQVPVQSKSSYAVSASIFLWIFLIYSQTLLAKYLTTKARVYTFIVVDMLGLLSFMVLVWALCVWILVGGKLSPLNSAMFLIWAILELFNSDNSIDAVYLPLLGIFFIGWHAMSSPENKNQMEGKKLLSTSIRNRIHDALEHLRKLLSPYRKRVADYEECQCLIEEKILHMGDSMEAGDPKVTWQFLSVCTTSYLYIPMEDAMHILSYELYNAINKHKPQVIAQRISTYVISTSMFLWIFLIYGQTLLAKYFATKARVSTFIVAEMLGLLSFMVLVWAVGVRILVGGKLSRMNCVLFLIWAILKLFNSDNSIDAVYLPILGIFFIGWHALSSPENKNHIRENELLSTSIVN